MAFNKSFNLTTAISDLTLGIRKSVLFSIVGSLNAKVFNAADKVATQLIHDGYDSRELTVWDIELLTQSVDDQDGLATAKLLAAVAREWRDMLIECVGNDESGSMSGTIKMLTGAQKMRAVDSQGLKELEAIGEGASPEEAELMAKTQLAKDQAKADLKAKRLGFVEFLLEHVFDPEHDNEDTEWYSQLDTMNKEQLVAKFLNALTAAKNQARKNVLLGMTWGDSLNTTDIVIINNVIKTTLEQAYPTPTTVTTMSVKPQPQRSRIPTEKFIPDESLTD